MSGRIPANRWWLLALVGVTTASLAARLVADAQRTVLLVDAMALIAGAAVVLIALRRAAQLTVGARRWHGVLIGFFVLGAIRAALWRQGLSVGTANLVVLGIGSLGIIAWAIRYRRQVQQAALDHPAA